MLHGHSAAVVGCWCGFAGNGARFSLTIYLLWVGELLVCFQDVMFLPSCASSSTTFLNNCGEGECLVTTTCVKTVVGVSKGMLSVKYFCSNKAYFCVSGFS